jgi:WD40 repeat protein
MSVPACPFPGLLPFGEKDAPFFFGRDDETAELLHRLRRNRFIAVIGVSGSGKSSLVRAGLMPELRIAEPPWRMIEIKPGGGPRQRLQHALEAVMPGPTWDGLLGKSSYGLVDGIAAAGLRPEEKLLVIVDQFEEIFPYRKRGSRETEEADLFVQQLLRASAEPGLPAHVMLTMRTDFLGHCALFRGLPEALNQGTYLVPRLTRHQQEEAITAPLAVSGVEIDPTVVDHLLNAAEANRDELPVLQHLLKRLWEEWASRGASGKIAAAETERTGSWSNAIDLDAESVFRPLDAPAQDAAALVFRRITERGTGERPIRTPCSFSDLTHLVGGLATPDQLRDALERFRSRDLLTWTDEARAGEERIDIPHECVTWRWARLANWIEEEDRDAQRLAFIAESARSGTPLAGSALSEALALRPRITDAWVARYKFGAEELTQWIDHSRHEATRARRRARTVMAGLALATVLFAALGVWAWQQRQMARDEAARAAAAETEARNAAIQAGLSEDEALKQAAEAKKQSLEAQTARDDAHAQAVLAEEQRAVALARAAEGRARLGALLAERSQGSIESSPELALLLALEAGNATTRSGEPLVPAASQALRRALTETGGAILTVPDGQYIRRWEEDESPVVISPDQRWLAAMGEYGADRSTGVRLSRLKSQVLVSEVLEDARAPAVFTRNSRWLATASTRAGILLWDLNASRPGDRPRRLATPGQVQELDISPDGKWLVSSPEVRLWNLTGGAPGDQPLVLEAPGCQADGDRNDKRLVRFSPDSRWLVTGGWYTAVGRVAPPPWPTCVTDLSAPNPAATMKALPGHTRSVTDVVFSDNGRRMATYSREGGSRAYVKTDDTVRVWDLETGAPPAEFAVAENDDARSMDGRLILSKTREGLRLWDFGVSPPLSVEASSLDGRPVALGPADNEGNRPLLTVERGEVLLWRLIRSSDVAGGWSLRREESPPLATEVQRFALSPDHATVAMASSDGTVLLADLRYDKPGQALRRFRGRGATINNVDLNRQTLLIVEGNSVHLWDLARNDGAADPITLRSSYAAIAGTQMVMGMDDRLLVWDLSAATPAAPALLGSGRGVRPLRLSDNCAAATGVPSCARRVVTYDDDDQLRLWRLDAPNQAVRLLWSPATPEERLWVTPSVEISPDGRWVAAGFRDGSVRLWDTTSEWTTVRKEFADTTPSVLISEDGRWLLATGEKGKACLWRTGPAATRPSWCDSRLNGARLVGKAPRLIGADGNRLRLWDLTGDTPPANPVIIETGLKELRDFAADPQGRWVAAYGDSLVVWRRSSRGDTPPVKLEGVKDVLGVLVSDDGRWLATAGGWAPIVMWDLLSEVPQLFQFRLSKGEVEPWGTVLALYRPPGAATLLAAAYSRSGFSIIAGFADTGRFVQDKTRVWHDLEKGVQVNYSALPGISSGGRKTITADGRWLIDVSQQTTTLYRLRRSELEALACDTAGRNLTGEEWQRFFSGQEYRRTCPTLPGLTIKPQP